MLRRLLIRACAFVVPAAMRPRWREEWLAELEASQSHPFDRRALGAVTDALDARLSVNATTTPKAALMSGLWFDIRSGIRQLQRHRAFTALSVGVLALGIGINGAIFSVVYTVFFKPWPIDKPEEVAFVYWNMSNGQRGRAFWRLVPPEDFRAANPGIVGTAANWGISRTVEIDGLSERRHGEIVTAEYFDVLGVKPIIGRTFDGRDTKAATQIGVVLSHRLWQERFDGAADVVGRTFRLGRHHVTVIGVAPAAFHGLTGVWQPSHWWAVGEQLLPRAGMQMFVRRRPDVTLEQVAISANILGERVKEERRRQSPRLALPAGVPFFEFEHANDIRRPQDFSGQLIREQVTTALSAVVAMVLVIATINITGLLLAKGITRTNEIATRRALGVTPARLARQLLTETIVLASTGGALGLLLAWNLISLFGKLTPDRFTVEAAFDVRVVSFATVVCLFTGLLIGLAPVRQALRVDVLSALAGGYRDSGRHRRWLRHWVIVPQVALSLLLLLVSGVHVRALRGVEEAPLGYDRVAATIISIGRDAPDPDDLFRRPQTQEERAAESQRLYRTLYDSVRSSSGITAGFITSLPLQSRSDSDVAHTDAGHAAGRPEDIPVTRVEVSPGAFDALGMRLLAGRDFDDRDTRQVRPVAIIAESIARRLWPGQNPIGQKMGALSPQQSTPKIDWYEVVGVVNDTTAVLPAPGDPARVYTPLSQAWMPSAGTLVIRGSVSQDTLTTLRSKVSGVDPFMSVTQVRPMSAAIDELLYPRRLAAAILVTSGLVGLGLACIGLYGVVSFSVARRLRELGIRATLGAQPCDLVRLVLSEGGRMAAVGSVIGLAGGIAALRYTAHLAEGVPATDALVFFLVPATLAIVILVAGYVPARRAGRVDPVETLRE